MGYRKNIQVFRYLIFLHKRKTYVELPEFGHMFQHIPDVIRKNQEINKNFR